MMDFRRVGVAATAILVLVFPLCAGAQQTGSYSLSNGYFSLSGAGGRITELRLDATGSGAYGGNTIAEGRSLYFTSDGAALANDAAEWEQGQGSLDISGLPGGAALTATLDGDTLTLHIAQAGGHAGAMLWETPYVDNGFYQRLTGQNYDPNQQVDVPFASFYNAENGNYRSVEMLKRTDGAGAHGSPKDVIWPATHCQGRDGNDVRISGGLTMRGFETHQDHLTLRHEASFTDQLQMQLRVTPTEVGAQLADGRRVPEFYVLPNQELPALHDPEVTQPINEMLSEFFHHMTYWWAHQGHSGGIWTDWGMMAGAFMDTPFRESNKGAISGWKIGDDGYGHDGYAFTWGDQRGWPFPGGRDTRHFNTNAIFITALWRYVMWTGDADFLQLSGPDRDIRIAYEDGTEEETPGETDVPVMLNAGQTLGQTFRAEAPFVAIGGRTPTWTTTGSGCTFALYDGIGGEELARQSFTNVADNAWQVITLDAALPAGEYYLEMSDPVGTIGWWTTAGEALAGGTAVENRELDESIMERARKLMTYQQEVLLAGEHNQIVMGTNIGTSDHLGRHGDVGSNYYDILPFGYHDAMTDIHFYQSLRGMADLEALLGNDAAAEQYRQQMAAARQAFNETYWREGLDREGHARYIGCVDVDGNDHDFGYTFVNTMALAAGLAEGYPERAQAVFEWLDTGESYHGPYRPAYVVQIGYANGPVADPAPDDPERVAVQFGSDGDQPFFADRPFTSVGAYVSGDGGAFTLTLVGGGWQRREVATQRFTDITDEGFRTLTFDEQPPGFYRLYMTDASGSVAWWASPWAHDIYGRWLFAPRVSSLDNDAWWQAAVGGNPASPTFQYEWDKQLQNGGADLYESGFDIWARATLQDPDAAWQRYQWILRRYLDPDRLSGNRGFYDEGIQGGYLGGGAVGWVWSEFPETSVLGAAFFNGFFGVRPTLDGLRIRPAVPEGHGITTLGARHISYQGALFNIEATKSSVRIICTENPSNKTFIVTGGYRGEGEFTVEAPLVEGEVYLSTTGTKYHSADTADLGQLSLGELLRVVQLYNAPGGYGCSESTADGYAPNGAAIDCEPHDSDYRGGADWRISLPELLRAIQIYQAGAYSACEAGEDGFCVGS